MDTVEKITTFILNVAATKYCKDCRGYFHFSQLDFVDKNDPKFDLRKFIAKTKDLELAKKELARVDIVCANCNRLRIFKAIK